MKGWLYFVAGVVAAIVVGLLYFYNVLISVFERS